MKRFLQLYFGCFTLLLLGLAPQAGAQSFVAEAQSNGFTLKKVVSDTAIATGQNFSYTIYFSIPAGATNVTITDALPANLTFQAISITSACGTPVSVTPAVGSTGNVTLSWASIPTGCSGSFVVTVQFPNGTTCNGVSARNNVCMQADLGPVKIDFCTGFVSTRAIASDPWHIGKWVIGAGTQPGPCPNITADSVITYQICVYKNVGVTGQLNMANAVVYDTLPAGATLVNSNCGATQSGNVVTWTIGALSALSMYNTICCSYSVLYPPALFPTGTQVHNQASLHGTLGSPNSPCGQAIHNSGVTCVEIKTVTSATLGKYVYTNGQPGCTGKYSIWICNNGSVPITTMTVTDTIPAPLTGISLGTVSPGLSAILTGNVVTVTLSSPLLPTQCRYFEVNFTIPLTATVPTVVTNCAHALIVGTPPIKACATFTITAPAPNPCVWKEVCGKLPSYTPGNIFRYRLRVQNIGGMAMTGATITDVLNPNLQYVGNPSYYSTTLWNAPCSNVSNWVGVSFAQAGNTLTFTLPSIPASCQNIFYANCGMYGTFGVPFYYIEFDVKVADTSALGNIPNNFTISGGNLTGPTPSNIDYVNVVGTTGFSLDKGVAKDTTSWASTLNTTAGSNVNYRLRLTVAPGSVGLRHVTLADLLPRDNAPNDNLILGPCGSRGSAFNIGYALPILTSPSAVDYKNATSFSNVNVFAPTGAPAPMFTSGCGTLGSWVPGIAPLDRNLGWYFGNTPIPAGNTATAMFTATVAPGALDNTVACNTFAANGAVRHLINSTLYTDQVTGNLESGTACVTVAKDTIPANECFTVQAQSIINTGVDSSGNCTYDVVVSINNSGAATTGYFESFSGLVLPSTLAIPNGVTIDTLTFIDTPPTDVFICIRYGMFSATGARILCDSLCIDLPPCAGGDPCDSLRAQLKSVISTGTNTAGLCTYTVDFTFANNSSSPIPVWFDSFQGAVTPAGLNIPVGNSTQTLTFTDTPPTNASICIRYGIFQGVQPPLRVVCDSVCFNLPPCDDSASVCDSISTQVKQVTSTGVNAVGNCTYAVDLSFSNASAGAVSVWFESFQGSVAPPTLSIPVGNSTQTVVFTDTPPTNGLVCIRYGYFQGPPPLRRILCDSVCFDITPCSSTPCDSLTKAELDTSCCDFKATIVNVSNTPITSISYSLTGGTVNSFITMPCSPVTPAPVGSSSGILTYSPSCNSNMQFMLQANPNTPSNLVYVTLVIHHGKDSCVVRFQYKCDRTPLQRCDDFKVKPFVSNPLNLSGRSFSIANSKLPASPITHINITPTPTPCTFIGGALLVDYVGTSWSTPFTRIPTTGFISANAAVSFNLAINYSCNWTGSIKVVVHHADGDSCTYTYGPWKATLGIGTGVVITDPIKGRVFAKKLRVQNPGNSPPVKWVSINVEAPSDVIIAGSGAHWQGSALSSGYELLEGYEQGASEALFTFERPVRSGTTSEFFNLVVARDSAAPGTPVVRWTTYDEEGNALSTDTIGISSSVLTVKGGGSLSLAGDFQLLHTFPNPAMQLATINYALTKTLSVHLELYNQLGERVGDIWSGFQSSGLHSTQVDVSGLSAGTYFIRLSSAGEYVTQPLIITR